MPNQQAARGPESRALALLIVNEPERGLQQAMAAYAPLVRGILQSILPRCPQDVEECTADVFVALWRNAQALCGKNVPIKAWLIVTARNTGIDRYRVLRRRTQTELPLPPDVAETVAELQAVPDEASDLVAALVAAMGPPDREIFLRKYYLMQPAKQIAAALHLSEANVNTRLSRGRDRLRAALARKGVHTHA